MSRPSDFIATAAALHARGLIASPKQATRAPNDGALYPYYAGFSSTFVGSILHSDLIAKSATILDPWNGAGTTTTEAARTGRRAIGVDINPFALLLASARLANPEDASHLEGIFAQLASTPLGAAPPQEPLRKWMNPTSAAHVRAVVNTILELLATSKRAGSPTLTDTPPPPLAAFLLVCVIRAVRKLLPVRTGSNPTWPRPALDAGIPHEQLIPEVRSAAESLCSRLSLAAKGEVQLLIGDARNAPVPPDSTDAIVSSPPYCTRIDYAVSTSLELAILGQSREAHTELRAAMTGTPLIRSRCLPDPKPGWGTSINRILSDIRSHPSPDSSSYYFKSFWQYFEDLERSTSSMKGALRSGGGGLLVVQSSYYKDILVDLPELTVSMLQAGGLDAEVIADFPVPKNLVTLNSRALAHRRAREYRESVVAFSKA